MHGVCTKSRCRCRCPGPGAAAAVVVRWDRDGNWYVWFSWSSEAGPKEGMQGRRALGACAQPELTASCPCIEEILCGDTARSEILLAGEVWYGAVRAATVLDDGDDFASPQTRAAKRPGHAVGFTGVPMPCLFRVKGSDNPMPCSSLPLVSDFRLARRLILVSPPLPSWAGRLWAPGLFLFRGRGSTSTICTGHLGRLWAASAEVEGW